VGDLWVFDLRSGSKAGTERDTE